MRFSSPVAARVRGDRRAEQRDLRRAGIAPYSKVLVLAVPVGKVVEQIDHWLPHMDLAVTPHPFPGLPRRVTA
jgi:hypothetical protein